MKIIIIAIMVCFTLFSCHQLNPGATISVDDVDITDSVELVLFEPGDSNDLELHYSEDECLYLELSGLVSPGIYSLQFSSISDKYFFNDIAAQLYNRNSCIGDGDYQVFYNNYRDEDYHKHGEALFEFDGTESKYAKIFLNNRNDDGCTYNVSFHFIHAPFIDPFMDYYSEREYIPGSVLTGCFSRLMFEPEDKFILSGFQENVIYKLNIDYDYSDSVFTLHDESIPSISFTYGISCKVQFRTQDRTVAFFSLSEMNPLLFNIFGYTGISYELSVQQEYKTFNPDNFEPDNGPISGTRENIIDTGWAEFQSESHTFIRRETDWIAFTPTSGSSYRIYLILEDTWYDVETKEVFDLDICANLIKPNGYEIDSYKYYSFNLIPENPVISTEYIIWENAAGSIDPWFIKIEYSNRNNCLQYSVKIEKI